MSRPTATPGRKLASGQLRVDFARAVRKLRDYQLVDPVDWVLEVVRAGTCLGATSISVDGDADDVWVRWPDAVFPDGSIPRLFDHLIHGTSGPDPRARALRWLAIGINAALGLVPRSIDVTWRGPSDDSTRRVRFTPELLATSDDEDGVEIAQALEQLREERCDPPAGLGGPGVEVHFRRARGWKALTLLALGREPDELGRVAETCGNPRIPVRAGRVGLGANPHGGLLRVPLRDPVPGHLLLVDPVDAASSTAGIDVQIAELGVRLTRMHVQPSFQATGSLPIRAFVDSDRLATNASRSELQHDEADRIRLAVEQALGTLLVQLARRLRAEPEPFTAGPLRRAALAILASNHDDLYPLCETGGPPHTSLAPFASMPLVRDAVGRPRSLADLAKHAVHPGVVHRGATAYPAELEPWIGDVPWVPPGDDAEALLARFEPRRAEALAEEAGLAFTAWRRWVEAPIGAPRVEPQRGETSPSRSTF